VLENDAITKNYSLTNPTLMYLKVSDGIMQALFVGAKDEGNSLLGGWQPFSQITRIIMLVFTTIVFILLMRIKNPTGVGQ